MAVLRALIDSQVWLSRRFDEVLPERYRRDGNRDFRESLVPAYLASGQTIYDIGGGKNPYLGVTEKNRLEAIVVGIDIDKSELERAPEGAYDRVICTDISRYRGDGDGDLLICQAVLEHVQDVESAFESIASVMKPGGLALLFVPSRNAAFARLNLLLPQRLKKWLLHTIFPKTRRDQGFPSYYDKCTPSQFRRMAAANELDIVEERFFYKSSYFSFFFPLYFIWRLWILLFRAVRREHAAETFSMVLKKAS